MLREKDSLQSRQTQRQTNEKKTLFRADRMTDKREKDSSQSRQTKLLTNEKKTLFRADRKTDKRSTCRTLKSNEQNVKKRISRH